MDVRILGVPMDLGANRRGTDMGPSAVRSAGLADRLKGLGHDVEDDGNVFAEEPETQAEDGSGAYFVEPIVRSCESVAQRVRQAREDGAVPLVVGGDHSISMGSVAGVGGDEARVGVLWVDAHADFNTPETSPSGNVHGMPLAALTGRGDPRLCEVGGTAPKVRDRDVVIVGARSVDEAERELLRESDVTVFTMRDIDERGMSRVMESAITIATEGTDGVHASVDLDSVDPETAPGVGTPEPGGLTYREAHLAMEMVADTDRLVSMDLVEVNPILDERNRTAELAVELGASAFGKKIV
jgi:arginase